MKARYLLLISVFFAVTVGFYNFLDLHTNLSGGTINLIKASFMFVGIYGLFKGWKLEDFLDEKATPIMYALAVLLFFSPGLFFI